MNEPNLANSKVAIRPHVARVRFVKRTAQVLSVLFLSWLALIFLARDPLHYLIDPNPESFGRYWSNRAWLLSHIIGGLIAVVVGPFQFSTRVRRRFPVVHRWSGRFYVGGILLASTSAFYLAFFAEEASFGIALFALAAAWLFVTARALTEIRRRRISIHRRWMIRSYIITFAFVTFRWLGILPIWGPFGVYRKAAATWVAWVIPLAVVELICWRAGRPTTETAEQGAPSAELRRS
jgi:uncharacterized membrane protein